MTQQVGKYQLIRKLATGGMAEVYLAKAAGPMGFEKTLVLKRILPHLAEEPSFVEMFLSEAKLAAQLTHPNIVQIFDFGEAGGAYFLAMEYIDGPNLRVLVKRATAQGLSLPPALCARIIAQACEGLGFAHDFSEPETGEALGLIHRDISPDNILLSRQGAVKVVDFGIAKAAGQSHRTQSGIVKGKVAYMPPEQLRAQALDRRADVYALGVVLYELLTAHKPFAAESEVGLMQAILFETAVPAAQYRPELPEPLRRILDRALAKNREQRYPDCQALQSDLEEFILSAGRPVTTQQLAQLLAQVSSGAEQVLPTPQPGAPRSGPRQLVTPVPTPAPVRTRTDVEGRDEVETVKTPRPQALKEDVRDAGPTRATPASGSVAPLDEALLAPGRRSWRLPALVGSVLLMGGVGVLLGRTAPVPETQAPPLVAEAAPAPGAPMQPPGGTAAPRPAEPARTEPAPTEPTRAEPAKTDGPAVRPEEKLAEAPPGAPRNGPSAPAVTMGPAKSARASVKPPRPVKATPKPVRKGTVEFRIRPYATIIVNGQELGDTPMPPVELPAGPYTVKLVNKSLAKTVMRSIEVKPDQPTVLKVNLMEE